MHARKTDNCERVNTVDPEDCKNSPVGVRDDADKYFNRIGLFLKLVAMLITMLVVDADESWLFNKVVAIKLDPLTVGPPLIFVMCPIELTAHDPTMLTPATPLTIDTDANPDLTPSQRAARISVRSPDVALQ